MSVLDGLRAYYREFGIGGVASITRYRLTGEPKRLRVEMPGVKHAMTIRLRTSDHAVFHDIFQRHEYLFNPPQAPATIVDAGANIGLASVYFANKWPDARIVAVEPDPENFGLLVENTKAYPNVSPVQAAVWKECAKLDLFDPGEGAWALQTRGSSDGRVDGLTVPEIMRRYGMPRIDLLKMDIEGAELEVFDGCSEWIDRIGSVLIEIHDEMRPGSMASVMQVKDQFRQVYTNGATWYLLREVTQRPALPEVHRGRVI